MLKPQDVVLLLKFLSNPDHLKWTQAKMAMHLCMSSSEINAGIKRLIKAGLLQLSHIPLKGVSTLLNERIESKQNMERVYQPIIDACEEFLISSVKYHFPVKLGEFTAGIATSYASSILSSHIMIGNDPIPVWPYAEGRKRGQSLEPLYPSVPKSVSLFPDPKFYDLLCLMDVLRQGRVRERILAIKMLKERINP